MPAVHAVQLADATLVVAAENVAVGHGVGTEVPRGQKFPAPHTVVVADVYPVVGH